MASRSFHDLLLRARDDLATSGRRSHGLVVALLIVHLAVVAPFADADRRRAARESERQRLAEVGPAIDQLTTRLEGLGGQVLAAVEPALDRLPETLAGDLERLEATRWQLQERDRTSDPLAETTAADPALAVARPARGVAPLTLEAAELEQIRRAENRYALLTVLEPIVERAILEPRFAEVERRWQNNALPTLEAAVETANGVLPRLRERFPEGASEWEALTQSLAELRRVGRELEIDAPTRPYWWASEETSETFGLIVAPATAELLRSPLALDQLATAATEVRDRMAGVQGVWRARLERTERGERDLGSALSALGIDLTGFAPLFPLSLGLLLAVVLLRRGLRLRQLAVATRHAVDHGAPDALRGWCLAELSGSTRTPAPPSQAERRAQLRCLGALALGWLWLAAAGYQLHGAPTGGSPDWLPTLLGGGAVLVAALARLSTAQSVAQLLAEPGPGEDFFFDGIETEPVGADPYESSSYEPAGYESAGYEPDGHVPEGPLQERRSESQAAELPNDDDADPQTDALEDPPVADLVEPEDPESDWDTTLRR